MSEWISVDDKLPVEFGWFLVVDKYLAGNKVTMGFFEGQPSMLWTPLDCRDDSDTMQITNWMPLPEPPK